MAKTRLRIALLNNLLRQHLSTEQWGQLETLLAPWQEAARLRRYPLPAPSSLGYSAVCTAITKATGERPENIVLLSAGRALRETPALAWEFHWWLVGRWPGMPFWDLVDLQFISLGAADPRRGLNAEDQEALGQRVWDLTDPVCHALENFVSRIWRLSDAGSHGRMSDEQMQTIPAWDLSQIPNVLLRLFLEFRLSGDSQLSQRLEETVRIAPYYLPFYERIPGEWVVLGA